MGELTVLFKDERTIYFKTNNLVFVAQRWFLPKSFYPKNWRPFRKILREKSRITASDIWKAAARFEISIHSSEVARRQFEHLVEEAIKINEGGYDEKIKN